MFWCGSLVHFGRGVDAEFASSYYLTCDQDTTDWLMLEVWTTLMT